MTPTRLRLYTAGVLVGLLGTALWSYGRLADARGAAGAAADNLAACRDLAAQIESLRRRPALAGARELKGEELRNWIQQAASAQFDDGSVGLIEPGSPRRLGDGPYRETPVVVRLKSVTLRQLFTFLHALAADPARGVHVRRVDLNAPRENEADDRWNVETTVAQLVYAPRQVSSTPPAPTTPAGPLE
jgi:hypothetical protein